MKKLIYVCSPYSGDIEKNIQLARQASRFVVDRGHIPIAPHLLLPQFMDEETERELALEFNSEILFTCDELWYFTSKITEGMVHEIALAKNHHIDIKDYTDVDFDFTNTRYELTEKGEDLLDKLSKEIDMVNNPQHYTFGTIEVIDVIEDYDLGYHLGNVLKYIARAKHKGNEVQDLLKAKWYMDRYVELKREKEDEKFCEEID